MEPSYQAATIDPAAGELVGRSLMRLTGAGAALTGGLAEIAIARCILMETFDMSQHYSLRCTALLLVTAGYGWAGGHFIPEGSSPWAYVFQFVILLLLLVFGVGFLTNPKRWRVRALSIFAGLTLVINVANIVQGAMGSNVYGSHNSFGDLTPIGMILAGDVIWLLTILPGGPRRKLLRRPLA